ncbi:MAG TPA: DNA-processing protein DprA [Acidimicrobiia bacterium]|nr:DNA-processing protein DprA [Acidimicrobiia bacterium]
MSRGDRLRLAFMALHPDRGRALLERHGTAANVLRLAERGKLDRIDAGRVLDLEECESAMDRAGCRAIVRGDADYPEVLGDLGDPPEVLFVRGNLPQAPGVAVIGTRRCTAYGRRLASRFGAAIAAAGWPLVSGLARGIDGAAHRGTIEAGGIGVVVLGSGSDVIYPRDHRDVHDALLATGGAAISEYPPGTTPNGWRFPPRNRIISGLSAAVVVVEAAVTGGALITATRAGEQGRVLFAVPGDVDRPASVGCNLLIRDGAVPVLGPEDLIEALSLVLGPPSAPPVRSMAASPDGVDGDVLQAADRSASPDDIAARLGIPIHEVLAAIGRLEIGGHAVVRGGFLEPPGGGSRVAER